MNKKKKIILSSIGISALVLLTPIALVSCSSNSNQKKTSATSSSSSNNPSSRDNQNSPDIKNNSGTSTTKEKESISNSDPNKKKEQSTVENTKKELNNKVSINFNNDVLSPVNNTIGLIWKDQQAIPKEITGVNLIVNGNGLTDDSISVSNYQKLFSNQFNLFNFLNQEIPSFSNWTKYQISFQIVTSYKKYSTNSKTIFLSANTEYPIGIFQDKNPIPTSISSQEQNVSLELLNTSNSEATYQWQIYNAMGGWTNIKDANSSKLDISQEPVGSYQYRLKINDDYSNKIDITINSCGSAIIGLKDDLDTQFLQTSPNQSVNLSINSGSSNVNFTNCSYQWQELSALNTNNLWQNINDATSPTYSFKTENTYYGVSYRLVITNKDNPSQQVYSNSFNINVLPTKNFSLKVSSTSKVNEVNGVPTISSTLNSALEFNLTPENNTIDLKTNQYTTITWQAFQSGKWNIISSGPSTDSSSYKLTYRPTSYIAASIRAVINISNNWRASNLSSNQISIFIPMPSEVQNQYKQQTETWINDQGLNTFLTNTINNTNTFNKIIFSNMVQNFRLNIPRIDTNLNANDNFNQIFSNLKISWDYQSEKYIPPKVEAIKTFLEPFKLNSYLDTKENTNTLADNSHYLQIQANNIQPLVLNNGSTKIEIPKDTTLIWTLPIQKNQIQYTVNDEGLNSIEFVNKDWIGGVINTDKQHDTEHPFGLRLLNSDGKTLMTDAVTSALNSWGYVHDSNNTIPFWEWNAPLNKENNAFQFNYLNSLLPNFYLNTIQIPLWNQGTMIRSPMKNQLSTISLDPGISITNIAKQPVFNYIWIVQEIEKTTKDKKEEITNVGEPITLDINKASVSLNDLITNPEELHSYQITCQVTYKIGMITHTQTSPAWTINISNGSIT